MPSDFTINRFTTEFSPSEDRIRMVVEESQQQTIVIWLTRRLLVRLIEAMVKAIESETVGRPESDTLQSFTQHRAQQAQVEEAPVKAIEGSSEWLINRVDLNVSHEQLTLKLFCDEECATLAMPRVNARQWLNIMHRLFEVAEWHYDKWPSWLQQSPSVTQPALVH
ncbi:MULTISPECIES: hypothetical protein [unclassified Marinobacterium]|jgi:hypothetical protein|uniref:hypothetical protein n=1 Tax=unclassified Marinobacterium TaxID=2644139 RepID=UPI001568B14E|nr:MULTISPECIES: hypothetical protein [unclassified Marinobacterium]